MMTCSIPVLLVLPLSKIRAELVAASVEGIGARSAATVDRHVQLLRAAVLFTPQRRHRIHAHCPSRGNVAGEERHAAEDQGDRDERGGVGRCDLIEQ